MIEPVRRLETQDQRGIPVLLENDRGKKRRFEAMRATAADDAPKAPERGTAAGLGVVREAIQEALDGGRGSEPRQQHALTPVEQAGREHSSNQRSLALASSRCRHTLSRLFLTNRQLPSAEYA